MADHPRSHNPDNPKKKKKPNQFKPQSPFMRALRGMFGFGVEGTTRALERSENVFERATKKIKKDTETVRRRRR